MTLSLDRQNAYRERYQTLHPDWQPATRVYESLIRTRLTAGARLLDLGCGRGGVVEQLGSILERPVGLDPDLESLREFRLKGVPLAQALADRLPLQESCVDVIVCSWVFEHLDDPARVLAEARRVLKPGGCLIFLTPNARSVIVLLNRLLKPWQRFLVRRLYGRAEADTFPVRYRANSPARLMALAAQAGLRLDALRQVEDPTYLAFLPLLFRASMIVSRLTPPVHLAGILVRE
ncbi:MAG TPA: class I SAM-dependent methyltransferase [Aggregatilineales bacterium]|nr:class I SAM-dependent methyltransferase [Aggregatilineales bacterium]